MLIVTLIDQSRPGPWAPSKSAEHAPGRRPFAPRSRHEPPRIAAGRSRAEQSDGTAATPTRPAETLCFRRFASVADTPGRAQGPGSVGSLRRRSGGAGHPRNCRHRRPGSLAWPTSFFRWPRSSRCAGKAKDSAAIFPPLAQDVAVDLSPLISEKDIDFSRLKPSLHGWRDTPG